MAKRQAKSPNAYRTISEVADAMEVPQHVLRFWEGKFSQIKPMKRGGGRRYYRPEDVEIIQVIRTLLHEDGYTIKGAQKLLREQGVKSIVQQYANDSDDTGENSVSAAAVEASSEEVAMEGDASRMETLTEIRGRLQNVRKKLKGELPS
ncbi:MerR family transcriptional regulator [Emcibacter nanhaiensis]|uniref:MerR family transcriptional regulator n=1 Tax=Emcibacter nanhaiensis TaxID=1505037 RepID=A0A501PRY5_9PROT|nr:MerR family transcriptional regulator [Emcibacter nanhaiensis]TPD62724.1 MerR family transcriptional regulator [Emcibacter nanhaiensis]